MAPFYLDYCGITLPSCEKKGTNLKAVNPKSDSPKAVNIKSDDPKVKNIQIEFQEAKNSKNDNLKVIDDNLYGGTIEFSGLKETSDNSKKVSQVDPQKLIDSMSKKEESELVKSIDEANRAAKKLKPNTKDNNNIMPKFRLR